jgi:hypothetical protein
MLPANRSQNIDGRRKGSILRGHPGSLPQHRRLVAIPLTLSALRKTGFRLRSAGKKH